MQSKSVLLGAILGALLCVTTFSVSSVSAGGHMQAQNMTGLKTAQAPAQSMEELIKRTVPKVVSPKQKSPEVSLERKIGQMLIFGFAGTKPGQKWPVQIHKWLKRGQIGGVILFEHNIVSPAKVRRLTSYFKSASPSLVPFIAVDQEGGRVQRLGKRNGFFDTPSAADLVDRNDSKFAYRAYLRMARAVADAGFNVNFGPVADLDVNPKNTVITGLKRSYGSDPKQVIKYASLFVRAHREAGVLTAAKHFPGHGSSSVDTHKDFADITKTWTKKELVPFAKLAQPGQVDMVMVGHLYHTRFSSVAGEPASLSKKAIQGELRKRLKFTGLVITDDLEMKAISKYYGYGEAIVRAISAGNDLVILSNHTKPEQKTAGRAIAAVVKAVREKRISMAQINSAYARIVAAKRRLASFHKKK